MSKFMPSRSRNAKGWTRREFLATGAVAGTGTALVATPLLAQHATAQANAATTAQPHAAGHPPMNDHARMHAMGSVGQIALDGSHPCVPMEFLTAFNKTQFPNQIGGTFYKESRLSNGQLLREYLFVARDKEIEIAPGIFFPAWTYNNQVPGPTLRATQGDRIRIWFINEGSHPHTIHFHGWHAFDQDGSMVHQCIHPRVAGKLAHPFGPGADPSPWLKMDRITQMRHQGLEIYEFDADPVGLHLYHCHSVPLKRHIHKGLYGVYIVDPPGGRPKIDPDTNKPLSADHPVHEMVMLMNGFDTNFDGDNEVYAVNSVAFCYQVNPIPVNIGDLVRVYLVNLTEFDPVNSFHLHASFYRTYRTGTTMQSQEYSDMAMFCQGERAILEFRFRKGWPGKYMFHAHQSEFAELGWMGLFDAREGVTS
jgi:FtsP/CotA-like multicopper oxidase with cupredoxin domain